MIISDVGLEAGGQPRPGLVAEEPGVAEFLAADVVDGSPVQEASLEVGVIGKCGVATGGRLRARYLSPRAAVEQPGISQRAIAAAEPAEEDDLLIPSSGHRVAATGLDRVPTRTSRCRHRFV